MKPDMQGVGVFTPRYLQSVRTDQCRASVHEEGRGVGFHQCLRDKGLLSYCGLLFCKQHHPPSIKAREAAKRRCSYPRFGTKHGAPLKKNEAGPWCRCCKEDHAHHVSRAKAMAYDRIARLLAALPTPVKLPFTNKVIAAMKLCGVPKLPGTTSRPGSPPSRSSKNRPA